MNAATRARGRHAADGGTAPRGGERARRTRGLVTVIRRTVLIVAAALGVVTVAAVAAGLLFGVGYGVVATGSMTPSIPAGSLTVTVPTPASELLVGDVVTVPRAAELDTVTHRIVAIAPVAHDPVLRDLTLRGDDNTVDDPSPYRVAQAQRVVVAIPHLGGAIWSLRTPVALGIGTVVVAGLVLWAFWPARPEGSPHSAEMAEATP